jgi:hypothetical protein
LSFIEINCLQLFLIDQDHVHTVRAFDTTKPTVVVTQETVTRESETGKSGEEPKQSTPIQEL